MLAASEAAPARRGARWALAGAFALLFAAAFPFRAGELHFDLGALVGWLALAPLALLVRGLGPRAAFGWAGAAATAGYALVFYWIFVVVAVHGHAPAWAAVAATLALAAYAGVHAGAAAALAAALEPRAGRAGVLCLPAAWVLGEALRTIDPGFPWAFLGYALSGSGPARGLATVGGVFGLSFLLATNGVLLARRAFASALALVVLAHAAGAWLLAAAPTAELADGRPRAGLVQANIPQGQKWDQALARQGFDAHLATSREALASGPLDLIVWPETSVPVFLQLEDEYRAAVEDLARANRVELVLGGMAADPDPAGRGWRYFNSVFALDARGSFSGRYDKSLLVPFGEYVPFRAVLGFLSGVATGIAPADVTPGPGPRPLELPGLGSEHAIAPLICYEVIYPALVRDDVRKGARVLVNVTNDAWYGRTSAPDQFLAIAALRSAEHGLPMLRAANTGVSAIIDARGSVRSRTSLFERRALVGSVPPARPSATLYTRLGDWILVASAGFLIGVGGVGVVTGRQRGERVARAAGEAERARRRAAEAPLTSTASAPGSPS